MTLEWFGPNRLIPGLNPPYLATDEFSFLQIYRTLERLNSFTADRTGWGSFGGEGTHVHFVSCSTLLVCKQRVGLTLQAAFPGSKESIGLFVYQTGSYLDQIIPTSRPVPPLGAVDE